jgi:hypothetical protein
MKSPIRLYVIGFSCLLAVSAPAQFYAPDTEYHDPVQRVFPVEAARVLAWRANRQQSNGIVEISYTVSTTTNVVRSWQLSCTVSHITNVVTSWQLSWLDASGKPLKMAKVQYASGLLKQGPGFYREVMRQLLSAGWTKTGPLKSDQAEEAFWKGAAQAGLSREESLERAFAMTSSSAEPMDETWVPQMAGLLVHAALPTYGAHVSLDDQLIARSAAWLALAENAGLKELPRPWAPVLFLAGREPAAVETWNKAGTNSLAKDDLIAAWNLWLKHPTTKETYLFAVDTQYKSVAMSMLAYDVRVNGSGVLLGEVIERLAGSERALASLHNYSPLIALHTSIGGGHILNGAWPIYQRGAWIDLLARYPDRPEDGLDFMPALRNVTNTLAQLEKPSDGMDASVYGFNETAPLMQMGQNEGIGKLSPTAVATARDLLNYGWEMTGLQMGARYHFVNERWGVPERAKPILETVTGKVQGLYPFFKNAQAANIYNYQECLFRLQRVGDIYNFAGWSPNPYFTNSARSSGSAELFMKRCWLRPDLFDWQARSFWDEGRFDYIAQLVDSVPQEEGPRGAIAVLGYLNSIRRDLRGPLPKADEWMAAMVERLPQPTKFSVHAVWDTKFHGKSLLETARELEKMYWQNPDSQMEDWVFLYYARSGAFGAARRFYLESRENLLDPVGTSSGLGHYVYTVGYLENDTDLREMALKDSASGSYADMLLHIWDAGIRDDRDELKQQVDELIERYESTDGPMSRGARMKQFLPLLPALANAGDPRHQEAINYFGNDASWVMLRWIWIEKFKLSKEDAIAFLGGRETDAARHVLACYLDGDAEKTVQASDGLMRQSDASAEQCILARFLGDKLAKIKEPDVPDLKPANASSARAAVLARLAEK